MKIAMWSGPRNLSTAMMYSFGNRSDCAVSDEPFYAAYLASSGVAHPMQQDILDSQPNDPKDVISNITGSTPDSAPIWYQKHMTHHMLPEFPLDWLAGFTNVFLIRHPARVISSYMVKRQNPTIGDLGFVAQKRIYDHCVAVGQNPVVIDSDDILVDPKTALKGLCQTIMIPFDWGMLSWSPGARKEDGVWAAHWYESVHCSAGFISVPNPVPHVDHPAFESAMAIYADFKRVAL